MSHPTNFAAALARAAVGTAAATILILGPTMALASSRSPAAHPHRCRAGGVLISIDAHPVCLGHREVATALRSAGPADAGAPRVRYALASAVLSLLGSRAPRGADRRLTQAQVARVTRALISTRAFASADAHAASVTTSSHSTAIEPPTGELGAGQTGVADIRVGPGQTGGETLTDAAFATACPDASGYLLAHAVYSTQTSLSLLQPHRLRLLSKISADAHARAIGHVTDSGKLKDFDVLIDVELSGNGRMVGPAGLIHGDTMSIDQKMRIVLTGLDPHSWQRDELSSAHIGSISLTGQGAGRYDFGADGSLLVSKDVDRILAFGTITLSKLRGAFQTAERNFYDDAKCLRADFSPSTLKVTTGSTTPVQVSVTSTTNGAPVSIDLQLSGATNGTVTPDRLHAAPSRPGAFVYNAGLNPGDDVIIVSGASRRGRVMGHLDAATAAAAGLPYYYRVLSASYSTHADGQTTAGNPNVCESQGLHAGGSQNRTGSSGALAMSDTNAVSQTTPGGALSGRVWADVPTKIDAAVFGCTLDSHGSAAACQQTLPEHSPQPNGTSTIGFSINASSADAATATLHWSVPDTEVGVAGGGSDPCNAPDLTLPIPYSQLDQPVPLARLSNTQPQTYSFSGGPLHWSTDPLGQPISLNYQWQYTLMIQRVNPDGSPIK